jgi:hypothetical protein
MKSWKTSIAVASGIAVALSAACRDVSAPTGDAGEPAFHENPPPGEPGQPAKFRLTGGGRVDQRDHAGFAKHTPDSRDFATFGFQARPVGPNTVDGSGNITWVEHNPAAPGGGFTFHGRVSFFTTPTDETAADADCARFGGTGRAHLRDGTKLDDVPFTVQHACDKGEPGVGVDHILIDLPGYRRHGLLSGGNIQKHKI